MTQSSLCFYCFLCFYNWFLLLLKLSINHKIVYRNYYGINFPSSNFKS
jgi:hypothetical protein